jgi:O-antigen ligase
MSGPVCLFVSCWFFSRIKLTPVQLKHLLFSMAIPLVSVAIATLFFTVTNPYLEFTNESNPMTSGGFGPNQVSSMLGLGAFIAAAAILLFKNDLKTALFLGALALLFSAQSVLTFSRGGMYAAVGALAVLAIFLGRNFGQFLYRILPVVAVAVIFMFVVFPNLNDFTGGKLEERFEDSDTTNRLSLLEMELQIFIENPFWGVGVGEAIDERYQMSRQFSASHTEFTRLLSEHGTFGILAITALIAGGVFNLRKQNTRIGKALVAGALAWSGLFMVNSGMRLAAPAFIWGLSCVMIASPIYANMASPNRWKRKPRQPAALTDRDQDALPGPTD